MKRRTRLVLCLRADECTDSPGTDTGTDCRADTDIGCSDAGTDRNSADSCPDCSTCPDREYGTGTCTESGGSCARVKRYCCAGLDFGKCI